MKTPRMFEDDDAEEDLMSEERLQGLYGKAESGDVEAQYELGWRHAVGSGFDMDDDEALKWVRMAAENGHRLAQNNMGARHMSGDGVEKDLVEAYVWFYKAASQGDRKAGKNCDSVARQMPEDRLAIARQRASEEG